MASCALYLEKENRRISSTEWTVTYRNPDTYLSETLAVPWLEASAVSPTHAVRLGYLLFFMVSFTVRTFVVNESKFLASMYCERWASFPTK